MSRSPCTRSRRGAWRPKRLEAIEASSTGPSCGMGEEGRGRASREHAQRRATGPSPALPCHALCTARWPIRRPYRPLPLRPRDRFGPTFLGALSRRPIPCRCAVYITKGYVNWGSATRGPETTSSMHLEVTRWPPSRRPQGGSPTAARRSRGRGRAARASPCSLRGDRGMPVLLQSAARTRPNAKAQHGERLAAPRSRSPKTSIAPVGA